MCVTAWLAGGGLCRPPIAACQCSPAADAAAAAAAPCRDWQPNMCSRPGEPVARRSSAWRCLQDLCAPARMRRRRTPAQPRPPSMPLPAPRLPARNARPAGPSSPSTAWCPPPATARTPRKWAAAWDRSLTPPRSMPTRAPPSTASMRTPRRRVRAPAKEAGTVCPAPVPALALGPPGLQVDCVRRSRSCRPPALLLCHAGNNVALWKSLWDDQGRCSNFGVAQYFRFAAAAFRRFNVNVSG